MLVAASLKQGSDSRLAFNSISVLALVEVRRSAAIAPQSRSNHAAIAPQSRSNAARLLFARTTPLRPTDRRPSSQALLLPLFSAPNQPVNATSGEQSGPSGHRKVLLTPCQETMLLGSMCVILLCVTGSEHATATWLSSFGVEVGGMSEETSERTRRNRPSARPPIPTASDAASTPRPPPP